MCDNLANEWGTSLVCLDRRELTKKNLNGAFTQFESIVRTATSEKFTLAKITECGSEANLYAVNDASCGNTDGLLIGAGMYVAGDNGPLQAWSTTLFCIQTGPTFISSPIDAQQYTREHVFPLPYHIPTHDHPLPEIEEYEDACLEQLHIRCLLNKMDGRPTKVLFLELVLCGNGSILSDRALTRLGRLSEHHGFWILVDEVLTGGRCGTMLLLQQKPKIFQDRVSHVTMGKWMEAGLVLVSEDFKRSKDQVNQHLPSRGPSTKYDCTKAFLYFARAFENLDDNATETRRAEVISVLCSKVSGLKPDHFWGKGVLLYGPVERIDSERALKNRFTPLLCATPVDLGINFQLRLIRWSRHSVNKMIMTGVNQWLHFVICQQHKGPRGWLRKCFCDVLSKKFIAKYGFTQVKDLQNDLQGRVVALQLKGDLSLNSFDTKRIMQVNHSHVTDMCADAARADLVEYTQGTGRHRKRGWKVFDHVISPILKLDGYEVAVATHGIGLSKRCVDEESVDLCSSKRPKPNSTNDDVASVPGAIAISAGSCSEATTVDGTSATDDKGVDKESVKLPLSKRPSTTTDEDTSVPGTIATIATSAASCSEADEVIAEKVDGTSSTPDDIGDVIIFDSENLSDNRTTLAQVLEDQRNSNVKSSSDNRTELEKLGYEYTDDDDTISQGPPYL